MILYNTVSTNIFPNIEKIVRVLAAIDNAYKCLLSVDNKNKIQDAKNITDILDKQIEFPSISTTGAFYIFKEYNFMSVLTLFKDGTKKVKQIFQI